MKRQLQFKKQGETKNMLREVPWLTSSCPTSFWWWLQHHLRDRLPEFSFIIQEPILILFGSSNHSLKWSIFTCLLALLFFPKDRLSFSCSFFFFLLIIHSLHHQNHPSYLAAAQKNHLQNKRMRSNRRASLTTEAFQTKPGHQQRVNHPSRNEASLF